MKVAMVVEQLRRSNPGGIGTYARELTRAIVASGTDVELVASQCSVKIDPLGVLGPVSATRVAHRLTSRLWDRDLLKLDASIAGRVDVEHATSFHYPSPTSKGSPSLTVFVHDVAWRAHPDHFSARGVRFHEAALARSKRLADHLLVPSRRTADALLADGIASSKITVVPEGCDHLPTPEFTEPSDPYLLTVSTIEPRKNLPLLVRAYTDAIGRLSTGATKPRLVIVGAKGWDGRSGALPSSMPERVQMLGSVSDQTLSDLLAGAMGFLYVPLLEGFGLPPLEAMRAGVPTVASSTVPSVTEVSGESPCLLVDPTNLRSVSDAVEQLITNEDMRVEYRSRGLAFAGTRLWCATADAHLAVWSTL